MQRKRVNPVKVADGPSGKRRYTSVVRRRRESLYLQPTSNTVYRFKRTAALVLGYNNYNGFTSPNGSTVYGNGLGLYFTLAGFNFNGNVGAGGLTNMPNISEFQALFDEFRLDEVEIKLVYTNNISNTSAALGTFQNIALPTLQTYVDIDDANPPSTGGDLLQCPVKIQQIGTNGPLTFKFSPRTATTLFTTSGANSVATGPKGQWLDTAVTNAQYYGWKTWLEPMGSNIGTLQQGYFQFYVTYTLAFKGFR